MRATVAANAATSPCYATEPASNATPAAARAAAVERKPPPIQSSRSVGRAEAEIWGAVRAAPLFFRAPSRPTRGSTFALERGADRRRDSAGPGQRRRYTF